MFNLKRGKVRKALTALIAAVAAALLTAPAASAIDKVDTQQLRDGVTVGGIMEHQQAFQQIATANGGNRAATFPGYDASVQYVVNRMRGAGFRVSLDPFDFAKWEKNGPSTLERTSPASELWVEDTDYVVSQFSGGGDVTAPVFVAGHTVVPPPGGAGTSVSGCDPADFNGMQAGAIALIQRGTCPFVQKYDNARDAGAGAALIFNDGFAGREDPIFITAPTDTDIPAIMISNDVGEQIYSQAQAGPGTPCHRAGHHDAVHAVQRDRRFEEGQPRSHDRGRRPPRLGRGGTRYQRQRLGVVGPDRDGRADRAARAHAG
jgi:hypothetical protein